MEVNVEIFGSRELTPEEQERLDNYRLILQKKPEEIEKERREKQMREFKEEAIEAGFTESQINFLLKKFSLEGHEHSRWLR